VYREKGDWIEYRLRVAVEFDDMGVEVPFVVRVMLLEIKGVLVSYVRHQSRVIGQLRYSPRRARLNTIIPLVLISTTGLLSGLSIVFDISAGICGSSSALVLSFLLLLVLKIHERLWVDGHEYEAIRMIKQTVLS
jgi:hypothetical protein